MVVLDTPCGFIPSSAVSCVVPRGHLVFTVYSKAHIRPIQISKLLNIVLEMLSCPPCKRPMFNWQVSELVCDATSVTWKQDNRILSSSVAVSRTPESCDDRAVCSHVVQRGFSGVMRDARNNTRSVEKRHRRNRCSRCNAFPLGINLLQRRPGRPFALVPGPRRRRRPSVFGYAAHFLPQSFQNSKGGPSSAPPQKNEGDSSVHVYVCGRCFDRDKNKRTGEREPHVDDVSKFRSRGLLHTYVGNWCCSSGTPKCMQQKQE